MKKFLVIASFGWEGPFLVEAESENEAARNLKEAFGSLLDESPVAYALARPSNHIVDKELNNHFVRQDVRESVKCLSEVPLSVDVFNAKTCGLTQYAVCTFNQFGGLGIQSVQPNKQKAEEEKTKLEDGDYDLVWIQEVKADITLAIDEH